MRTLRLKQGVRSKKNAAKKEATIIRQDSPGRRENIMKVRETERSLNAHGTWVLCGQPTKRCAITVAVGNYYCGLLQRQDATIREKGFSWDRGTWRDIYPVGSPAHTPACAYCFKAYAMEEAVSRGYTTILWLDSSIQLLAPLDPLFDLIESQGHYIVGGENIGWYASDEALREFGISRDEAMNIPSTATGVLGMDLTNARTREFFDLFLAYTKAETVYRVPEPPPSDPRYRGSRADETLVGWLAHKLSMHCSGLSGGDKPGEGTLRPGDGMVRDAAPSPENTVALVRTDK